MTQLQQHIALFVLLLLTSVAWSQETPPAEAKPADAAKETAPKFSATLLLIKADWSKSPHAKEIEAELREALKDASVPKELLDKLPESGPDILFGPQTVALYSEEHHAELMAWLKAKELIVSVEKFVQKPLPPRKEIEASARANAEQMIRNGDTNKDGMLAKDEWTDDAPYYRSADLDKNEILSLEELVAHIVKEHRRWTENIFTISKDDDFIELPKTSARNRPFVKSQAALVWEVFAGVAGPADADGVTFNRQLTMREQVRGQDQPGEGNVVDSVSANLSIKEGRVLVINAFPAATDDGFRQAARAKGFEAVVMIGRTLEKAAEATARVHAPDWIDDRSSFGHGPRMNWPVGQAGRMGSMGPSQRTKSSSGSLSQRDSEEAAVTKIIHLQRASAAELRNTLQQLAPADIKLVADERTNAIIVSGPEGKLAELEAIVLRLDEPADSAAEDKRPAPQSAGTVDELKHQYADAEQEAAALAKESKPAKDKLRAAVAKAFELRQKLLQAELAEFRQRSERIQQSLQQREGIKQQIIERRVEELLTPGSEWEGADATPPAGSAKAMAAVKPSPEQAAQREGAQRLQELELQHAETVLRVAETELAGAVKANQKAPNTIPTTELVRLQAQVDIASLGVQKARTMLDLFRRSATAEEESASSSPVDRTTQIKLLELDLKQATLELEALQTNHKYLEEVVAVGNPSYKYSELTEAKLALYRAQAKLEKAQTLLDAAHQTASPNDGKRQ